MDALAVPHMLESFVASRSVQYYPDNGEAYNGVPRPIFRLNDVNKLARAVLGPAPFSARG